MSNEKNNLQRPQVSQSQATDRYLCVNNNTGALDAAITQMMEIEIADGVNTLTLATQSGRASGFTLIPGTVTANFNLVFPSFDRGFIFIKNSTGYIATIGISGQSSPPQLINTAGAIFFVTHTGVIKVVGSTSITVSAFTDLSDVP